MSEKLHKLLIALVLSLPEGYSWSDELREEFERINCIMASKKTIYYEKINCKIPIKL